jgi:hypothetical protein
MIPSTEMTYYEGADKELDEEEIAISLSLAWERTKNRARPTEGVWTQTKTLETGRKCRHLRMVLSDKKKSGQKGAEDLSKDVIRDFFPWKSLPYRQTDGDTGVEMTS